MSRVASFADNACRITRDMLVACCNCLLNIYVNEPLLTSDKVGVVRAGGALEALSGPLFITRNRLEIKGL